LSLHEELSGGSWRIEAVSIQAPLSSKA